MAHELRHLVESSIRTADTGSFFGILSFCVKLGQELGLRRKHRPTEPHSETLKRMGDDIDLGGFQVQLGVSSFCVVKPLGHVTLDIAFQTSNEMLEHRCAAGQCDVLVESTATVDRGALYTRINDLGEGNCEIGAEDFRAEENLRPKEPFISNVDRVRGFSFFYHSFELTEPIFWIRVVFLILFHEVGANIAIRLLNLLRHFNSRFRGKLFTSVTKDLNHEVRYIPPGQGNVLDTTPNHIPLKHGDDVGNSIS